MLKILVIEEEARIRELLRHDLELDGYRVLTTASSQEGLELMELKSPDLVIVDELNREMDSMETVSKLLSHCPRIPVVLTSEPSVSTSSPVRQAADAWVPWSPDTAKLRYQVRQFLMPDFV